jgi:hypothetical protein
MERSAHQSLKLDQEAGRKQGLEQAKSSQLDVQQKALDANYIHYTS